MNAVRIRKELLILHKCCQAVLLSDELIGVDSSPLAGESGLLGGGEASPCHVRTNRLRAK